MHACSDIKHSGQLPYNCGMPMGDLRENSGGQDLLQTRLLMYNWHMLFISPGDHSIAQIFRVMSFKPSPFITAQASLTWRLGLMVVKILTVF